MFSKALIVVLSASSLVAGHGKPVVFKGDVGGNGTALAIQGAVVPSVGPNAKVSCELVQNIQQGMLTTYLID